MVCASQASVSTVLLEVDPAFLLGGEARGRQVQEGVGAHAHGAARSGPPCMAKASAAPPSAVAAAACRRHSHSHLMTVPAGVSTQDMGKAPHQPVGLKALGSATYSFFSRNSLANQGPMPANCASFQGRGRRGERWEGVHRVALRRRPPARSRAPAGWLAGCLLPGFAYVAHEVERGAGGSRGGQGVDLLPGHLHLVVCSRQR